MTSHIIPIAFSVQRVDEACREPWQETKQGGIK